MDNKFAIFAISAASTYNGCGRCTSDELQEAKKLAYVALEKQITRAVNARQRYWGNGDPSYKDYYCPICSKQQKRNKSEEWYCERCGQKLAWVVDND